MNILFLSTSHASNGLALATLFTAAVILLLGVAVVVRSRASLVSVLFAAITLLAATWLVGFSFMYESGDAASALMWARFAAFFACLIPAMVFHFSIVYSGRQQSLRVAIALGWLFSAAVAITSTTSSYTNRVERHSWGYYPRGHLYNLVWVIGFLMLFVISIRLMVGAANAVDTAARRRARLLIRAFAAGAFAFIDILPTIGVNVYPLGFLALLAFAGIAADAIWRYELVQLTQEYAAAQILATMKGAVAVIDLESNIRVINRAALRMLGYESPSELVGKNIRTIIDPADNITSDRLTRSSGSLDLQMVWRAKDSSSIDVLISSSFVRSGDGSPVGIVYAATDVTERRRAEQAMRESEHRYRTLFEGNPLPMWVYDFETLRIIAVNEAAVRHYGYKKDEFLRLGMADIQVDDAADDKTIRHMRHRRKDGTTIDADVSSYEFVSGGRRSKLVIAADVTERRRTEKRLRESEERYRLLFERNLAGVFRTTVDGRILDVNDAMARMLGYEREELLSTNATAAYFSADERARLMTQLDEQKALSNIEVRLRRRDGAAIWVLENMTLLESPDGSIIEGTIVDITDRKTAQDQIEYQAYHDILTGLPNRALFRDRITVALAHARRYRRAAAVMFLDLDRFKLVNDTLGHTVGDGLLQAAAQRLVGSVRAEDTVARMGGDEFTILLGDAADAHAVVTVAGKVLEAISAPIVVEEHELSVTTSIGIAVFPEDGGDAESLLKAADSAMYRAKENGRNNYQFATSSGENLNVDRLALERGMHRASERHEFVVYYQPIIETASDRVVGAEALVRWNHPVRGLMLPAEFITVAEDRGLTVTLGEWVLRSASEQMTKWRAATNSDLRISVNFSARQFQQRDLASVIERILAETGLPPNSLEIEITESTAMKNADLTLNTLNQLKQMGVGISLDDFGTGYSSLSYLRRFPINTVKIDHDFVRDLTRAGNDAGIVSAIISMAHALNMDVVAEGVETEEQLAFLQKDKCEYVQGFLYSRPVPAAEFEATQLVAR